jgi:hypothetical protein
MPLHGSPGRPVRLIDLDAAMPDLFQAAPGHDIRQLAAEPARQRRPGDTGPGSEVPGAPDDPDDPYGP